jgi:hypothetical protein
MAVEYSVHTCRALAESFGRCGLLRPMRQDRYEAGTELTVDCRGVVPDQRGRVHLSVKKFVGGGFAGQVYRVEVLRIDAPGAELAGLTVGGPFALKVLVPPSGGARRFRDLIYGLGFQAPFSHQASVAAVRAGALWQKLIRRAAGLRFGTERAVADIYATLVDHTMGSCGELREWVDGRNWRFEVDDQLDARHRRLHGQRVPDELVGSREYLAKRRFMADFVRLLHEMGAVELARQYEWWTCKSQPNVLKRLDTEADPAAGLTAVDFRAGLALLPCLPMSPADVVLIGRGIARGSLVQFDRGDLRRLEGFLDRHAEHFADLRGAFEQLRAAEDAYRRSQPDVTHHHVRLLYSRHLWRGILDGAVTGWEVRNRVDAAAGRRLRRSRGLAVLFALLGALRPGGVVAGAALLIAALIGGTASWPLAGAAAALAVGLPLLAGLARKLTGRADLRRHYARLLTSPRYALRALRGRRAETLIRWHRRGRVGRRRARRLYARPLAFGAHWLLSALPAGLHRFLTDAAVARRKLSDLFVRPVRLAFNPEAREQWLRDMLRDGLAKGMLTDDEARQIDGRLKDPFIQKYLKSLAVHVCTLPVTQVVSVIVAVWYKVANNLPWGEAWDEMLLILAAFQATPISPGSLLRGLYVLYLVIRERNFRDYNVAVFVGFFKYVGYLAFPIQMAYRYPALARFMAAHWATEAVRIVPVFGERGALLEHGMFDLFYNRLLTIRRRLHRRAARRVGRRPRAAHAALLAPLAVAAFVAADLLGLRYWGAAPTLRDLWWMVLAVPALLGASVSAGAGGATLSRRMALSAGCAVAAAAGCTAAHLWLGAAAGATGLERLWAALMLLLWRVFLFALLAVLGALFVETRPVREEPARTDVVAGGSNA